MTAIGAKTNGLNLFETFTREHLEYCRQSLNHRAKMTDPLGCRFLRGVIAGHLFSPNNKTQRIQTTFKLTWNINQFSRRMKAQCFGVASFPVQ